MWIVYAVLSAVVTAVTSILAKIGIQGVDSNLAIAIRTIVVLVMAWAIVLLTGSYQGIPQVDRRSWLFLILSGCGTGLCWLLYYKALQLGPVSKVVPIDKFSVVISMVLGFVILKETVDAKTVVGGLFITVGTLLMIL